MMLGGICLMHSENDEDLTLIEKFILFVKKHYEFFIGYIIATIIMIFVLR